MITTCPRCGKRKKNEYEVCYDCHVQDIQAAEYRRYRSQTPQEREDEREAYYARECVMCGKEGADYRSDGKPYCGHCWQIWNS